MGRKFSPCAKLIVFVFALTIFLLTLCSVLDVTSNGASVKSFTDCGTAAVDQSKKKCDYSKLGAKWVDVTCGNSTAAEHTYYATLWELCVKEQSGISDPTWTCYDYDDTSDAELANVTGITGLRPAFKDAGKAVAVAFLLSIVLFIIGCAILVDDDINVEAKTSTITAAVGIAYMICGVFALAKVHSKFGDDCKHKDGDTASSSWSNEHGGGALIAAQVFAGLVVSLVLPCFCKPCHVCVEDSDADDGGDEEEGGKGDGSGDGEEGAGDTAVACAVCAACFVALNTLVEVAAKAIGVAYTVTRRATELSMKLLAPLICIPCFLIDKIVPDKYNPTRCAQRSAALFSYCSLLLVVLAVFASEAAKINIEPGIGAQATGKPTEGWFGTPYVKATCEGAAGNHTYIATMFEVCQGTGWPYEGTVICYDYSDGVAPPGLRPNADHWDVVSKTMGSTAFGLYLCTLLCQTAMTIMMTCILCCRMCGGLPTLIYTVGGTAGLTLVLQIALMADINENLIRSTSAWKCAGADASPVEGIWLTMLSFFVNLALFITCFWPVCKCICPCLRRGEGEEEDGGDEDSGNEQVSTGGGKKMVV